MLDKINFENTDYEFCKNEMLELIDYYLKSDNSDFPMGLIFRMGFSDSKVEDIRDSIKDDTKNGKKYVNKFINIKKSFTKISNGADISGFGDIIKWQKDERKDRDVF